MSDEQLLKIHNDAANSQPLYAHGPDFLDALNQYSMRGLHAVEAAVRADQIKKLRWLADARDEYVNPEVRRDTDTARHLADILDGTNDAAGWLPSWKWDEWATLRAQLTTEGTNP